VKAQLNNLKIDEEKLYETRLALIKKIHEDQIMELKKTIEMREVELEDKIYSFNKH
jgi:hypothetical protein